MIGSFGLWPVGPLGSSHTSSVGAVDWDQVATAFSTLAPPVVGVVSDLTRKRKESLTGLTNERARLEKKLSKAKTSWDREKYSDQIEAVDAQIAALQAAISTDAPESSLDIQLEQNKPTTGNPLPFVLGGIAVLGLGGLLVWSLTKKEN